MAEAAIAESRECKDSFIVQAETYLFFASSALCPIIINHCNGAKPVPFGKAYIDCTVPSKNASVFGIPFAFLYKDATDCFLDMILGLEKGDGDICNRSGTTLDGQKKAALACIKKYLIEDFEKHEKCLLKLRDMDGEVMVRAILATHFFAPLIPAADKYGIDKQHFPKDEQQRKCPSCGQKLRFTDTSFGNSDVWHGFADIILQNCAVTMNKENDETRRSTRKRAENYESDSDASLSSSATSSSFSSVEVEWHEKSGDKQLSKQEEAEARALAQTITNAFCEESNRNKLIPSFLATNEKIKIYMYCSGKDVLLESNYLPIFAEGSISIKALVLVWLAVNFDYFQVSDVFGEEFRQALEYELPVSNFHTLIGEAALKLYQYQACRPVKQAKSQQMNELDIGFHPRFYKLSVVNKNMFDMIQLMDKINLIGKK